MTFWCGSGSGAVDLCLWLMDPNPDPAIFVIDHLTPTKTNLKKSFSAYYFLKVHLHHFSKIKWPKEVKKQYESRFFLQYYFCLLMEGSGSVPLTNGSGSGSATLLLTVICAGWQNWKGLESRDTVLVSQQGSIYWNKYGLMGKKYHENIARAPTKKEKKKERTREKKR